MVMANYNGPFSKKGRVKESGLVGKKSVKESGFANPRGKKYGFGAGNKGRVIESGLVSARRSKVY